MFRLENINFSVAGLEILKDISFSINDNDFAVLLGPSGSGKSTLLRMLNCLNTPNSGEIYFHNNLISDYDVIELRKKVGMVFQSPTMINGSVKDNLILTQQWNNSENSIGDSELITMLEQVDLDISFLNKEAKSLSGGEQQRIALARVLLNKPEVLLLDEPSAGLTSGEHSDIVSIIGNLGTDVTVLLIAHDMDLVFDVCARIIVLHYGQIIADGPCDEVRADTKVKEIYLGM